MERQLRAVGLVEILIALVILAIGILIIVRFQGTAFENRSAINQRNEAIQLAHDRLEQLRHYQVLDTTSGKTAYEDIASGSTSVTKASATYAVSWNVTENTSPDHKVIDVTVTWVDQKNQSHSITISTIVGKINPATSGTIMQGLPL
jgi:Tfp pilus assembly protein PilV